jgi:hypothetical protein
MYVAEASHLALGFGHLALGRHIDLGGPLACAYMKIAIRKSKTG